MGAQKRSQMKKNTRCARLEEKKNYDKWLSSGERVSETENEKSAALCAYYVCGGGGGGWVVRLGCTPKIDWNAGIVRRQITKRADTHPSPPFPGLCTHVIRNFYDFLFDIVAGRMCLSRLQPPHLAALPSPSQPMPPVTPRPPRWQTTCTNMCNSDSLSYFRF